MEHHSVPSGNPLNPSGLPQHVTQSGIEDKIKHDGRKNIYIGLGLVALSIIITAVSYRLAKGNEYYVFWGIAVWGAVVFARGMYVYFNPHSAVHAQHRASSGLKDQKGKGLIAVVGGLIALLIAGSAIAMAVIPELRNGGYTTDNYLKKGKESCLEAGGNDSYCGCAVRHLVDNTSLERLKEIDEMADSAINPPEITAAAKACIQYFPGANDSSLPADESI